MRASLAKTNQATLANRKIRGHLAAAGAAHGVSGPGGRRRTKPGNGQGGREAKRVGLRSPYRLRKQTVGLRHPRTRPYTPDSGKAERLIQTALREWAYARAYSTSSARSRAIGPWLHYYNHHRSDAGIHAITPAATLNNLLGNDS